MKNTSTELKVGLFAIIVIIFLTYMTIKVGSLPMLWEKGYRLQVEFEDISGLDEQSRVKVAGVEAGVVEKIELIEGKAKLTLLLNPDIHIYKNAKAYMRMAGLLGDKYLALSTGTSDQPLMKAGEMIENAVPAADIGMLANQLSTASLYLQQLTENLNNLLGETQREELKESIANIKTITANIKDVTVDNKDSLNRIIVQMENFTKSLSEQGPGLMADMSKMARDISDRGPDLIRNLDRAASGLREVIEENRSALRDSMENIRSASRSATNLARKIEEGEGTLGKLMQDDTLYNSLTSVSQEAEKSFDFLGRLKTYLDFYSEYNTGESEWKGYFDLTLRPREDKYYILGITADPVGSVRTTDRTINGATIVEQEVESEIEFTAQFAKRFEDLALRIGLMENTFGLGADYFFDRERGRVKLDLWDLSADEADADDAHLRVGLDYRLFKFFFVSGGVDNILNASRRGLYVGGGIKFEDDDLKYLFGSAPSISLK